MINSMMPHETANKNVKGKHFFSFFKRCFDFSVSLVAVVILLPFFFILTMVVFFSDFNSPFYCHERIGKDGKPFKLLKFRTMKPGADNLSKYLTPEQIDEFNREFKLEEDPRITKIGLFMRKFSLDEFPQFLNVIAGQMSIIGPRPLVLSELDNFGKDADKLLSVRPGITGLWQVSGRNYLTYESGERQATELSYIDNYGFRMDAHIFWKTFSTIFQGKGV